MDISKIKPWNWFKKEQEEQVRDLPVKRPSTEFYGPLTNLHEEVDRLFNEAFRRFGMPSLFRDDFWPRGAQPAAPTIMRPNVDISAGKNEYLITIEVPGIDEKDVKLELSNNTLTIKGEKRQEQEEKDRDHYRIERSYGSFQRVLSLPEDADQSGITAKFKNGVLTVGLPRRPEKKKNVKLIDIQKE
ncbi:Hsp20/alpha crystallin family protein [Candidatus Moduliflexota bacterium]